MVALALHSLIAWFTRRLTALEHQSDRDRYVAQAGPVEGVRSGPVTPTPTTGGVPPAGAVTPPPSHR
jgi:hypothetical protein